MTLRYFAAEKLSSSTLVLKGFTFLFKDVEDPTFEGLNCIFNIFSNCSRHARSVGKTWPSVAALILITHRACSHLWLHSSVCVRPGRKPRRQVFPRRGSACDPSQSACASYSLLFGSFIHLAFNVETRDYQQYNSDISSGTQVHCLT